MAAAVPVEKRQHAQVLKQVLELALSPLPGSCVLMSRFLTLRGLVPSLSSWEVTAVLTAGLSWGFREVYACKDSPCDSVSLPYFLLC